MDSPLVLIDGECALCNRAARFVIRRDPDARIGFAALQSARAISELSLRGLPAPPPGTFVLLQDGLAYTRSDAALRLLGLLPAPWKFATMLLIIPKPIRDGLYLLIARARYRMGGRTQLCGLLTAEEKKRFLP